jgi:lysophospholipase L1-like esterase
VTAGRRWLARAGMIGLGIALGVLALVAVELVLRAAEVGDDAGRYDPFAGFSRTVPMFEPATRRDGTAVLRTARARKVRTPQEFLAAKPANGFRVFVVGESSAAGVPYTSAHAFSAFLAERLRAALPDLSVEVVNAAVPGYGSRRMLPVVEDIARHHPDLLILYAGHNEFAEPRYYAHLVEMDPRVFRVWEWLAQTRLYRLAARLPVVGVATDAPPPRFDFEALDNPLQMFAVRTEHLEGAYPTERERAWAEQHYRFNVEQMVETMRRAGARMMLVTIGQNLADWSPGASANRADLTNEQAQLWRAAFERGTTLAAAGDCAGAVAAFEQALALDDRHAGLHFALARCLERLERFDEARAQYLLASDLDRMPHGAPSRFNEVLREVARERGALLVDAAGVLEDASPHGLVGDALFVDLVHPNLEANQLIAAAIAGELRARGVPLPAPAWRDVEPGPDAATLRAADPALRSQELLVRASACLLAKRDACARDAVAAALAHDPSNVHARQLRDGMESRRATEPAATSAP